MRVGDEGDADDEDDGGLEVFVDGGCVDLSFLFFSICRLDAFFVDKEETDLQSSSLSSIRSCFFVSSLLLVVLNCRRTNCRNCAAARVVMIPVMNGFNQLAVVVVVDIIAISISLFPF